jgi:DNA-binding NtrC family response regulator
MQDSLKAVGNILIIDDDVDISNLLRIHLEREGHSVSILNYPERFFPVIDEFDIDVVLLDIMMPGSSGFDVLKQIRQKYPELPVIMVTALQTASPAVTAMKMGAFDYVTKPTDVEHYNHVKLIVRNAVSISHSVKELKTLKKEISTPYLNFNNIIGNNDVIKDIFDQIKKVANSNISVLISGESGTGKELIARAVHFNSDRKNAPFADVNCAAMPENLIESELFGHEKGAFTGAHARKIGKFEQANTGTLFLDEIGDMPTPLQAKILRAIQEKSFERVGGNEKVKVDVRIISATNKDLKVEVVSGNFRSDLFYRLSGFPISLPPLRQRVDDIPSLVNHFIRKFALEMNKMVKEPAPETLSALKAYAWPGNIRELENVIQRAVVLTDRNSSRLEIDSLPLEIQSVVYHANEPIQKEVLSSISISSDKSLSFDEIEMKVIQDALTRAKGNVSLAAERLKIGRATMYRKIEKYGIKKS